MLERAGIIKSFLVVLHLVGMSALLVVSWFKSRHLGQRPLRFSRPWFTVPGLH
jgi:hypothetical protein